MHAGCSSTVGKFGHPPNFPCVLNGYEGFEARMTSKGFGMPTIRNDQTIGVDISKDTIDVYMHPKGLRTRVPNSKSGFRALSEWLSTSEISQIIYEPTGQYHLAFEAYFLRLGVPLGKVNPRQARRFADAIGVQAKTDPIDAELLAQYGAMITIRPVAKRATKFNEMRELQSARRALIKDRIAASNRAASRICSLLKRQAKERISQIEQQLRAINAALREHVCSDELLKARFDILLTIPGVGETTAITLLVEMPELGELDHKAAASLAGLAPIARDSGTFRGRRFIQGGRAHLRQALYMPALVSIRHNPEFRAKYDLLISAGKAPKLAITVVMRKLLILANSLLRDGRLWTPSAT